MTDCELVLKILSDGQFHNILEIMQRAKPGCINFAARSRISDLKRKGYQIESELDTNGCAKYRLLLVNAPRYDSNGQAVLL